MVLNINKERFNNRFISLDEANRIPKLPLTYFDGLMTEKDDVMRLIKCQRIIDKLKRIGILLRPRNLFNPNRNLKGEDVRILIQNAKIRIRLVENGILKPSDLNTAEYVFLILRGGEKFTSQESTYKPKTKKKS